MKRFFIAFGITFVISFILLDIAITFTPKTPTTSISRDTIYKGDSILVIEIKTTVIE